MNKTIRIITSDLGIQLPLWVRKDLDVGPNRLINFTPVAGMLWLTAGDESDIDIIEPIVDRVYIPDEVAKIVGFKAYDLVDLIVLDGRIYITDHRRSIPKCQLCNSADSNVDFEGILLCDKCFENDIKIMFV